MLTYTYVSKGKFELMEKPKPVLMHERDAIVKVTLASICSSDLHIKHGSVPPQGKTKEEALKILSAKSRDNSRTPVQWFTGKRERKRK